MVVTRGESNTTDPKPILVYSQRPRTPMQTQEFESLANLTTIDNQEENEEDEKHCEDEE